MARTFGLKMQERITDVQFLDYVGGRTSNDAIEIVNQLRCAISDFTTVDIEPASILPGHRIESDLGIHHVDSLDLVDLATSFESDNLKFGHDDLHRLAELNRSDATVSEIAELVLAVARRS